ncbi:MAG: hypothetical protein A2V69_01510 [Candidatus Portnoybacteria bacterium RBG_13_40_8]|uniref:ABC transporter ATP-binding protein n=1 Tax=Candidatus Portnoybacteria bacterium RBG_13_40_8 TaxID=1801990 RepID=A0A1G2F536_9BACT|nr:MAG: hypothetical protein A2V69_01510 [Candidatus Portnoybacteria bacterium RBG_13_40_8]
MIYTLKKKLISGVRDIMSKNRLTTITKLSKQAFGRYKLQIFLLIILGFVTGTLEGIGINAAIPVISLATEEGLGEADIISQTIEKAFLYFNIDFSLKYLLVFIVLLFVFKAIALVFCNYIRIKISANYEEQTRNNLFSKTINANWSYLIKQKLGYLETILKVDIANSTSLLNTISAAVMTLTGLIIYTTVAINISSRITLFALVMGSILFFSFKPLMYRTRIAAQKVATTNKQVAHFVNENIIGIKTVKTMFVNDKIIEIGKKYFNKLKKIKVKIFLLKNCAHLFFQPTSLIFVCIVFLFAYKSPNFSFAAFIPITYLIYKIFQYIQDLQQGLHTANELVPHLEDVLIFEKEVDKNREKIKGSGHFKFDNDLELKNVNFSYNRSAIILNNLSFNIKKGEMVGLIGPSGVGKTTIVDLILRLFPLSKGEILMNGKNISKIDIKQWRKNIGYIPQDIFLINDTITNNIRFYDDTINKEEIEQSAKKANIYDFIQTLPKKFSTIIGERGIFLSAGQRQRIVIARILARNPEFLILDEATSALDNESEIRIQKIIENLKGKITVLAIAHRLSTVINCDKLLILEKGKIIEQGIPGELLKDKKSYFYKIYNIRK